MSSSSYAHNKFIENIMIELCHVLVLSTLGVKNHDELIGQADRHLTSDILLIKDSNVFGI